MYGGDEVNALVIDVGSSTVKAGYAGEDTPKALFPSVAGCVEREKDTSAGPSDSNLRSKEEEAEKKAGRDLYVGSQALAHRRDHMEVVPALREGLYDDWDLLDRLWDHALRDRLRVMTQEHPLLLAEPSFQPKEARERVVELAFEKYQVPATFLAKNAVLSSFAMGRQTSLVVESGHMGTVACAVYDGYVMSKSCARGPIGGALLSQCMRKAVEARGATIIPRYALKRVERQPGQYEAVMQDFPQTTASYREWAIEQIAADIKEAICRVSDTPFDAEENANIPTVSYELPDGTEISVGPDRFKVPEVMFQPNLLSTYAGLETVKGYDGGPVPSIQGLVLESINKCDVDIRRELFNSVILAGGNTLFTSMRERLERELAELAPQAAKVKVTAAANTLERRFSVWLGGSILASLGSFHQMWMSKAEYDEHGANLIHRKAP